MSETGVAEELRRIEGVLARARTQMSAGAVIDLSELDEGVRSLCDRVSALPVAQARPFRARLLALYDELGLLAEAVRQTTAALQATLGENAKRRQAASAYGQTPGRRTEGAG